MDLKPFRTLIAWVVLGFFYLVAVSFNANYNCIQVSRVDQVQPTRGAPLLPVDNEALTMIQILKLYNQQKLTEAKALGKELDLCGDGIYNERTLSHLKTDYETKSQSLFKIVETRMSQFGDLNEQNERVHGYKISSYANVEGLIITLDKLYLKIDNKCGKTIPSSKVQRTNKFSFDQELSEVINCDTKNAFHTIMNDLKTTEKGRVIIAGINEMVLSLHNLIQFCIAPFRVAEDKLSYSIINFYMTELKKGELKCSTAEGEDANGRASARPYVRRGRAIEQDFLPNNGIGFVNPLQTDTLKDRHANEFDKRHAQNLPSNIESENFVDEYAIAKKPEQKFE